MAMIKMINYSKQDRKAHRNGYGTFYNVCQNLFLCNKQIYSVQKFIKMVFSRLFFYTEAKTGGYVKVINREKNNEIEYHPFVGKTTSREFEYQWDLVPPYHNLVKGIDNPQFLIVPDLTENVSAA